MATIYFAGGEDHDFTKIGACSVDTGTTAARRTAYARCALKVGGSAANGDGWAGTLSSPQASFWLTARLYVGTASPVASTELFSLRDASGIKRIWFGLNSGGIFALFTKNAAGTNTQLASTSGTPSTGSTYKFDVFVNYGANGSVQVYLDSSLFLSYSGNTVTDSASTLASFVLSSTSTLSSGAYYWSEVIASDADTRFMSLITLAPVANGNTNNWDVGTVGNINETTLDDATVITSGTAGQLAQYTVGSAGVTGNVAIKAVCVSARAGKGLTGPQNAKFSVRTGGADYLSGSIPLQSGSVARIQAAFMTNPTTGNAWTNADLTAAGFNVGIQSEA